VPVSASASTFADDELDYAAIESGQDDLGSGLVS